MYSKSTVHTEDLYGDDHKKIQYYKIRNLYKYIIIRKMMRAVVARLLIETVLFQLIVLVPRIR